MAVLESPAIVIRLGESALSFTNGDRGKQPVVQLIIVSGLQIFGHVIGRGAMIAMEETLQPFDAGIGSEAY